jgi:hypothetical protein
MTERRSESAAQAMAASWSITRSNASIDPAATFSRLQASPVIR